MSKKASSRGFVLLTAMVMLLVLTIVSLFAITMINTQRHIAGNSASIQAAFNVAQSGAATQAASVLQNVFSVTPLPCASLESWSTTSCGAATWPVQPGQAGAPAASIETLPAVTRPGESAVAGSYPGNRAPIYRVTVTAANPLDTNVQATVQELVH